MAGGDDSYDAAMAEDARKLFAGPCDFMWGTAKADQLPEALLPEIAFAGRSNVGKSSLINALTGRKTLAKVSNTPGRTQQLNFFNLGGRLMMVDMPGHGFAQVSKQKKGSWERLIRDYLRGRPTLRCVFVLVDSRHGLKDSDRDLMEMLDKSAVPYRIVMTKADKAEDEAGMAAKMEAALKKHPAAWPKPHFTSSETGRGVEELRTITAFIAAQ